LIWRVAIAIDVKAAIEPIIQRAAAKGRCGGLCGARSGA
jgi:hypothetical protein